MESPMTNALCAVSRRGSKRFRVAISKSGGGGGGEVLARGMARVFRCCSIQASWYPGTGVKENWAGCVLGALDLGREARGVEVVGEFSCREFTWDTSFNTIILGCYVFLHGYCTLSLSSSDSDLREQGIPTGCSRSCKEDSGSSSVKVSVSEAAKEMVENALHRKPGGEDILEEYRSEKSLSHRTRRQLVNILASDLTEKHGRIPSCQQKEKYALGIITLFPSLKDPFSPKGYVNQDFLLLFGAETKLLEKWYTSFKPKIIKEAKQLTQSADLCRLLKAAEKLGESRGRRTKISLSDAVDKMVHFHKSCCSIDEHLQEREGKQPYILAVGRTQNRIDTFYIAVDKQLIPCQATSSLNDFDQLFKSHYVFNLSYEESLVHLYTFVQTTVFNIDVTSTDESPRVCELRAKILNEN
ncbi:uncharacterized protein LOC128532794 [Clarias gariepinus]|uniref:uncharacterized protein LOC128532794 n=1 Tax=Clarias gariepinus TaxID=13013 RepID=UPI00234C64A9|nr:uncharacterized protein LOC128532794 [Clarias gariepinus]